MTPATLRRLAGYAPLLPSARRLVLRTEDGTEELDHRVMEVYEEVPELLVLATLQFDELRGLCDMADLVSAVMRGRMAALYTALRLPADAPWPDVLSQARHLAGLYANDPLRTRDDEDDGATVDEVAVPVGKCRCGAPVYVAGGFCGVCDG